MEILQTVLEVLKYTLPALIVLLAAYLMIKQFLDNETDKRRYDERLKYYRDSIPIRLQAYERLVLFLERVTPTSMVNRVAKPEMSVRDLQLALIANIRLEFEHNLSQQIYVSGEVWYIITQTTEELITIINRVAMTLPDQARGRDLAKGIFEYFA